MEDLQGAMYAIAYTDGGAPTLGESFSEFLSPDLAALSDGESYSWQPENAPRPFMPVELSENGRAAIHRHLTLNPQMRHLVELAANRLVLSRRRAGSGDGWVDAAIVLESLLGTDKFDLTYKIALRSALIVAEHPLLRLKIQRQVKEAYGIRSSIVHGGEIKLNRQVSITEFQEIAATVIRKLAEAGRLPDWPLFDLTAGTQWAVTELLDEPVFDNGVSGSADRPTPIDQR